MILAALGPFGDAIDFIFHERQSQAGTVRIGGLGAEIFADPTFRGNVVAASVLMVLLATALELIVLLAQRAATPWERAANR